jgi:uncharacterized protein
VFVAWIKAGPPFPRAMLRPPRPGGKRRTRLELTPPLASSAGLGHLRSMDAHPFSLAGAALIARASGALWWPAERLLCVADLHLGKSERLARRGGSLLPPYETTETLERLAAEIVALAPATVVCLGDSFDDCAAGAALTPSDAARLGALMSGRDWIWIAGNHDPDAPRLGGDPLAEFARGPLLFRHAARAGAAPGEVSGHYHPKLRLPLGCGAITRPCFLADPLRLVLPAFGVYTGGLFADAPALAALLGAEARAILTGRPCIAVPLAAVRAITPVRRPAERPCPTREGANRSRK